MEAEKRKKEMIANGSKVKFGLTDILAAATVALFFFGIRFWFPVCAPMEMGFMTCHWAGEVLKGVSWLLAALTAVHIFVPDGRVKIGMDISVAGICILALNVPGGIVNICPNPDMSCRTAQPWTIIFCVLMSLIALADVLFYLWLASNEKHKRD